MKNPTALAIIGVVLIVGVVIGYLMLQRQPTPAAVTVPDDCDGLVPPRDASDDILDEYLGTYIAYQPVVAYRCPTTDSKSLATFQPGETFEVVRLINGEEIALNKIWYIISVDDQTMYVPVDGSRQAR